MDEARINDKKILSFDLDRWRLDRITLMLENMSTARAAANVHTQFLTMLTSTRFTGDAEL
jgi:hypothetical protein